MYDYNNSVQLIPFPAGLPPSQIFTQYYSLPVYEDGLDENVEGFVLYLDVSESEVDTRDVGQVDLNRVALLVTINQSGLYHHIRD